MPEIANYLPSIAFTRHRFEISQNRLSAPFTRKTLAIGILLNSLFGIGEYFLLSRAAIEIVSVRFLLVTPPVLAMIAVLHSRKVIRHFQPLMAALMMWIGMCAVAIAWLSYPDIGPIAYMSVGIAEVYILLLSRLRLSYSMMPAAMTLGLLFVAGQLQANESQLQIIIAEMLVLTTSVLCALSAYHADQNLWSAYLMQRRLASMSAANHSFANRDLLTGLMNRRAMMKRLNKNRAGSAFLAMLDIDHFKCINDRYGHAVGDAALKHVAEILTKELMGKDILARWGGEEFLLVLSTSKPEDAMAVMHRLLSALRTTPLIRRDDRITLTATAGLVPFRSGGITAALAAADRALYKGKRSGRDTMIFDETITDKTSMP